MTRMLERAFEEASRLPPGDQDALAQWLLEELKSERRWADLLNGSGGFLEHLADEAIREHRNGRSKPLDTHLNYADNM